MTTKLDEFTPEDLERVRQMQERLKKLSDIELHGAILDPTGAAHQMIYELVANYTPDAIGRAAQLLYDEKNALPQ